MVLFVLLGFSVGFKELCLGLCYSSVCFCFVGSWGPAVLFVGPFFCSCSEV